MNDWEKERNLEIDIILNSGKKRESDTVFKFSLYNGISFSAVWPLMILKEISIFSFLLETEFEMQVFFIILE